MQNVGGNTRSRRFSVTGSMYEWTIDHEARARKKTNDAAEHVEQLLSTQDKRSEKQRRGTYY